VGCAGGDKVSGGVGVQVGACTGALWALAGWVSLIKTRRPVLLQWTHYFSGPGPTITPINFPNIQNCLDLKNRKTKLPCLQNWPIFARLKMNFKGTSFLLGRS
jgi:hypothetical protein